MKLFTIVEIPTYPFKIALSNKICFIGSCFSENIGNKFSRIFMDVLINPFGVTYNPISIAKILEIILDKKFFTENYLFEHDGLFHSFMHHSSFSNSNKTLMIENINKGICYANDFLLKTDFMFITFGTSWVYLLKSNSEVVNNCHKLPPDFFERKLLTVNEIFENFTNLLKKLKSLNPKIKIFFTVSPVRHLKDGAIQNQQSKATLILATKEITEKIPECYYFPAYEIVMDELRDYRFFEPNLTHPNNIAVDYIWEIIVDKLFDKSTKETISKLENLRQALEHKLMNPSLKTLNSFLKHLTNSYDDIKKIAPFLNFCEVENKIIEIQLLIKQLQDNL